MCLFLFWATGQRNVPDYEAGFEQAVRHIIEYHGITDTAMIAGIEGKEHSEQRIMAYKKVLAENNLPFTDDMLSYGDYWSGPAQKAVEEMIARGHVPKAIICANDMMAITVCAVLSRKSRMMWLWWALTALRKQSSAIRP